MRAAICFMMYGGFMLLLGGNVKNPIMPRWFKKILLILALAFYALGIALM